MLLLPTQLTHDQATGCVSMLKQAILADASATEVVLDATSLVDFDSSALAVLLECRRMAQAQGKAFSIKGLSDRLKHLATLYGVAELMPVAA